MRTQQTYKLANSNVAMLQCDRSAKGIIPTYRNDTMITLQVLVRRFLVHYYIYLLINCRLLFFRCDTESELMENIVTKLSVKIIYPWFNYPKIEATIKDCQIKCVHILFKST